MYIIDSQALARSIDAYCSFMGITKKDFHTHSHISSGTLSQWRKGTYDPDKKSIERLEAYTKMPLEDFLAGKFDAAPKRFQIGSKRQDYDDVYEQIAKKLPDNPIDGLAEELQIMLDNPATRTLLFAGRHLSEEQINNFAKIMESIPEGENVTDRKR